MNLFSLQVGSLGTVSAFDCTKGLFQEFLFISANGFSSEFGGLSERKMPNRKNIITFCAT